MIKFCALASGSSGNCLFVGDENSKILVDCGISGKKTSELMRLIDENIEDINGILITHEHIDHISGVGVLTRKYKIPVYIKKKTFESCNTKFSNVVFFNDDIKIGSLNVHSFPTCHDAADPVGYIISSGKSKVAVATDTGIVTREMYKNFEGCKFAYIESNHDVNMLTANPNYSFPLKQRILSENGHLSNKLCADLASALVCDGVSKIMLGHLSRDNNTPEIAYETTRSAIIMSGVSDSDFSLYVANRNSPSDIITV